MTKLYDFEINGLYLKMFGLQAIKLSMILRAN